MKQILKRACIYFAFGLFASNSACAAGKSTEADALALVAKAQMYIKEKGVDKAFEEFNRLNSPFNVESPINKQGDLYLFSLDYKGLQLVHGKNPKIRGQTTIEMRDQNGVFLIREMAKKCEVDGKGWVSYVWPNPLTRVLEQKMSYIERIPGTQTCIGTGIYK
ncbi:MAG: cache domain-containing protein [Burkholderiales bacterium]|nr:cache domain-containing protein [Burkholderiales bacterium]